MAVTDAAETGARGRKLCTIQEAVERIGDGARLALGGFGVYNRSMAVVRELIRQRRRNLTLVATTSGQDAELLIGAGVVSRLETSYIGLEKWGLARRARRAIERGEIEMVDYGEVMSFDRFRASEDGWSFLPVDYLAGNSLLDVNTDIVEFTDPMTGQTIHAVPPATPDVVVIHAPAADVYGNVLMPAHRLMPQGLDLVMSRTTRRVIVTAERIVDPEYTAARPHLVQIPSFRVERVAFAPWGAHPGPMFDYTEPDEQHFAELVRAAESDESFEEYLDRFVHAVPDHAAYLDLIGMRTLLSLRSGYSHD